MRAKGLSAVSLRRLDNCRGYHPLERSFGTMVRHLTEMQTNRQSIIRI
jgi:hypothetical protein